MRICTRQVLVCNKARGRKRDAVDVLVNEERFQQATQWQTKT
jgi:hypothetical protein